MTTAQSITTAEQLLKAGDIGRCELVRGELIMMTPAGAEHGGVAMTIAILISDHVRAGQLGKVYAAETGFVLSRNPDSVRAPDAAFVRSDRLPKQGQKGYFVGAPDLAVEVLSPNDRAGEVLEKVQDWLGAGCRQVWVIDPRSRTVSVYQPDHSALVLTDKDHLSGGDVLPGFDVAVSAIFE